MCTVTFVPREKGSYILTSNRDENPKRVTEVPGSEVSINEFHSIVFPKDSKAGGTWIAMSKNNRVVCLLNGAFQKHHHSPPYRKSRGLILLETFDYNNIEDFISHVYLDQIEPFTMILIDNNLHELRWDGTKKYINQLDFNKPHIWSSATLYDDQISSSKRSKFENWISQNHEISPEMVTWFHGWNNPEGFLLDRENVKTVSITSIYHNGFFSEMKYHDLLTGKKFFKKIDLIG